MIPLWVKIPYILFVSVLVPVYWIEYGPANFLWFSDIALLAILVALWLENRLLASMMAVAVLFLELVWNVEFFMRVITGANLMGLADYMFDPKIPVFVRALSLFHVVLPVILFWMIYRLGYDKRALVLQTLLAWIVLPTSYLVSNPSDNVNWVFGLGNEPQNWMPGPLYVMVLMVLLPLLVYLPTHFALKKAFASS